MPIPTGLANMAAQNPNGSGNGHSSRGAYTSGGRNRHRPQPNRNNRRNGFPDDYSNQTYLDGQYSQDLGAVAPNAESVASSLLPKERPRKERGFSGPPRNVYRRQPDQHVAESQRQDYTPRNGSNNYNMQDHPLNQNRSHFSQYAGHFQPIEETRSRNSQPRASQSRDPEANFQHFPPPINYVSTYTPEGNQGYNRGANEFAENASDYNYSARGATARPKQGRGPKKQKPKPEYKKNHGQSEHFDGATAVTYENSSYQQNNAAFNNYPSIDVIPPVPTLEHQPFENIRREYSQYRSRPTFTEAQYESGGGKRNSQDRYRREENNGRGHNTQERFHRDESSGSYGSRDRFRVEDTARSNAVTREQPIYNKPATRSYDSQNWRSEAFKKGISGQKQKVVEADTATQRERLTTQLTSGTYECMVCCESVKPVQVKIFLQIDSRTNRY